jgi:hypothetical protein
MRQAGLQRILGKLQRKDRREMASLLLRGDGQNAVHVGALKVWFELLIYLSDNIGERQERVRTRRPTARRIGRYPVYSRPSQLDRIAPAAAVWRSVKQTEFPAKTGHTSSLGRPESAILWWPDLRDILMP